MAMLAEPRTKKNYVLMPRGKALYEDKSRFGTKMLEKMGWTKGKGLGLKEDGGTDFVRTRYKLDCRGLGYEVRDDQWTEHEQSFNGLLKSLNGGCDAEAKNDSNLKLGFGFSNSFSEEDQKTTKESVKLKEKISGISLEEKSKQSKARVHYKKFTKGKDLTQYSEKDLANIFGKKVVSEEVTANKQLVAVSDPQMKEVQLIDSNVSICDYFKMKMKAKNNEQNAINNRAEESKEDSKNEDLHSEHNMNDTNDNTNKKRRKKEKQIREQNLENEILHKIKTEVEFKKDKSGKLNTLDTIEKSELDETNSKKKKQKSKRGIRRDIDEEIVPNENLEEESITKKRKNNFVENINSQDPTNDISKIQPPNKKRKKEKKDKSKEIMNQGDNEKDVVHSNQNVSIEKIKKIRLKKNKKNNDSSERDESSLQIDQCNKLLSNLREKSPETTNEDVSCKAINCPIADFKIQALNPEELKKKCDQYNIFNISSFCAEKFRNVCLNEFPGSSLPEIEGYGLGPHTKLHVRIIKRDEERITNLWKCVLNKYVQLEKPVKTYKDYIRNVIAARKNKQKRPKLYVKTWQRKNAFKII